MTQTDTAREALVISGMAVETAGGVDSSAAYWSETSEPCLLASSMMVRTSAGFPASANRHAASKIARSAASVKSSLDTSGRTAGRQAASHKIEPATL